MPQRSLHTPGWFLERLDTPLGVLLLITDEGERVRALDFEEHAPRMVRLLTRYNRHLQEPARPRLADAAAGGGQHSHLADSRTAAGEDAFAARTTRAETDPLETLRQFRARPVPSSACLALARYFAGDLAAIESVDVSFGGTPFQRQVWAALRRIPAGRTISYTTLAAEVGRPRAVRAVGTANGSNPIGIVVPCHRVIGADGSLAGYAGGVARKQWLLEHEGRRRT